MKTYTFEEAKQIGEQMQKEHPEVKLYIVDGHFGANEWTIRFTLPKLSDYKGGKKGTQWYDEEHKTKSNQKKRWKCNKFGKVAYPNDKVKAKKFSNKLYKEW